MSTNGIELEYGSRVRPRLGESVGGDAALVYTLDRQTLVVIVDVLGHGPEAHEVVQVIEASLSQHRGVDVVKVMTALHQRLRGTRGAAVGLCVIDPDRRTLHYVGVGNTSIRRFGSTETRLVSQDGVLGQNLRTLRPQSIDLEPGDVIVLHTDGVSDHFSLNDYPGVLRHPPSEIASNIVTRFGKDYDDAACIAVSCAA